jgi:hypothetical protein
MGLRAFAHQGENGTERHQSAHIGAESPGGVPEFCSLLVPRHTGLLNRTGAQPALAGTSKWRTYGLERVCSPSRSVDCITATNVAQPEPQRQSIGRSLRRHASPSIIAQATPVSGLRSKSWLSSVTITVTGFRTDKFPGIADFDGRV